ncbi:Protein of unknown function [Bacillus thuringiensis]|uniref:Uncharacterized protein n=1 Tax=Bacillus thuringiensis TaxID=1428 RepID=A0A1C4F2A5_BACTU|nr:Protein of unknown function [Bacillus thuringiensis]
MAFALTATDSSTCAIFG